ncbi:MAG TPA: ABC transporter permease subunit [Patescibacteria group bacterium]|nr:ABC transporter permease subunit [Patescibacteria group bacterium]
MKQMDIREKGYRHWEGELKSSHFNWLPITLNGVKTVFKKKYAKLIFSLSASTFFVFLAAVYVSTKPELKILSELVRLLKSDAELFKTFYANGFLIFMLVILSIFSGADLISADLKSKAFPLYFARPLSRSDYLTGKFSIVLFYLLSFTLVPGILLLLFKMIFTGSLSFSPLLLLGIIAFPLIACVFLASLTLALSILSPNTKFIQIAIFLVYMFSNNLAQILRAIFKSDYFFLVSLPGNIQQLGCFVFGTNPAYHFPAWLSALLLTAISALAVFWLSWRIKKAEAQT